MCSAVVASLILEMLEQKVLNGDIFTSFDVTSASRSGSSDNVTHSDVRDIVNNEFMTGQMTGYDRELCDLDISGSPQALVYFPSGKVASDHPLVSQGQAVAPVADPDDDDDTDDVAELGTDEYSVTAEGRIQIPRKILTQVTANAGSYDVLINGSIKCAKPDARGDVRVCLRQFGIDGSKIKLVVNSSTNSIDIETV